MRRMKPWHWGAALFAAGIVLGGWLVAQEDLVSSAANEIRDALGVPTAQAQGSDEATPKLSPVKARPRDAYFPNSEGLNLPMDGQ